MTLRHWPGAGGSTLVRRICWDTHRTNPVVLMASVRPAEVAERLQYIFSLTRLPILVVVDSPTARREDMDRLYDLVRSANTPCVFLQLERRFDSDTNSGGPYLDAMLSILETTALVEKLSQY